jgi:hypothetical protein
MRIDSVRVAQFGLQDSAFAFPDTAMVTKITIRADTTGFALVSFEDAGNIAFYLDTLTNRIYHFYWTTAYIDPFYWGSIDAKFDSADIYRFGKDYRMYLYGADLAAHGGRSSGSLTPRRSDPYIYWNDPTGPDSWIEMIFYGSVPLGVNDTKASPQFSIYPNPASNIVTIKLAGRAGTPEVCDILGRKLAVPLIERTAESCVLDLSLLPSGIYYVSAGGNIGKVLKK